MPQALNPESQIPNQKAPSPRPETPKPEPPTLNQVASSEENPEEISMGGKGYSVAFDPLDGSSIFDTGFAVGTICGIWPGRHLPKKALYR